MINSIFSNSPYSVGILLALFFGPISIQAQGASQCENALIETMSRSDWTNQASKADEIRREWQLYNFSSPSKHDPRNFRYIIRGLKGDISPSHVSNSIQDQEKPITFSASLISQDLSEAYTDWGLVLKIPSQNIIATTPFDMGSTILYGGNATNHFERYGIHSPEALLHETLRAVKVRTREDFAIEFDQDPLNSGTAKDEHFLAIGKYNEIRFYGSFQGSNVQVIGLFVQTTSRHQGRLDRLEDIKTLTAIAQDSNLPVVFLTRSRF